MNGTIVTPPPSIERDRWSRPLVMPPGGGKKVPYSRCTSFIDVLSDRFNLEQWGRRMVAIGLATRPDLLLSVSAHLEDKDALNRICKDATEAAKASAAATRGTALHALTELIDRGKDLPEVLPDDVTADLDAYRKATTELTATHIETFMVQDPLKIGGTPDRVVKYDGKRYIADLKTGSIEWGIGKISAQLAVYARSKTYDVATGARGEHGADIERGIIIHLPAGEATCTLWWVDLLEGWNDVILARNVREARKKNFASLAQPFGPDLLTQLSASVPLEAQIKGCATADDVRALWSAHAAEWSDDLTEIAKKHIASLAVAS